MNTVQNSNLSGGIDFSSENCLWVYDIRRKFKEKKRVVVEIYSPVVKFGTSLDFVLKVVNMNFEKAILIDENIFV